MTQAQAAIDIGTNTMLLLAAELEVIPTASPKRELGLTHQIARVLDDQIDFVRLGQGVQANRCFANDAMDRALACFQKYKKICDELGISIIRAVATSASRDSANAAEFYAKVKNETGISVQIIPGETEAKLSFLGGLLPEYDPQKTALLDIGGGSTEFVAIDRTTHHVSGSSVDMGCVRAKELYLKGDPYTHQSLEDMETHFRGMWAKLPSELQHELREKEWIGIAGTPTTLAAYLLKLGSFDGAKVDGFRLNRCDVADCYEELASMVESQREEIPLIAKGRADIIVSGTGILLTAMEYFDKEDIVVSSRGLRHGILIAQQSLPQW